jgi:hypothetical protein
MHIGVRIIPKENCSLKFAMRESSSSAVFVVISFRSVEFATKLPLQRPEFFDAILKRCPRFLRRCLWSGRFGLLHVSLNNLTSRSDPSLPADDCNWREIFLAMLLIVSTVIDLFGIWIGSTAVELVGSAGKTCHWVDRLELLSRKFRFNGSLSSEIGDSDIAVGIAKILCANIESLY